MTRLEIRSGPGLAFDKLLALLAECSFERYADFAGEDKADIF